MFDQVHGPRPECERRGVREGLEELCLDPGELFPGEPQPISEDGSDELAEPGICIAVGPCSELGHPGMGLAHQAPHGWLVDVQAATCRCQGIDPCA